MCGTAIGMRIMEFLAYKIPNLTGMFLQSLCSLTGGTEIVHDLTKGLTITLR